MEIVQCTNLSFDYGAGSLLHGASFRIIGGERLGLIGANGSGKTTLARLITGELEPTGGTVTVRSGARTELVPQDVRGDIRVTVRDLILGPVVELERRMRESEQRMAEASGDTLARELRGYEELTDRHAGLGGPNAESNAERALARVGLAHRLDARMGELSGGERNLVLIAKALAGEPDLIIMDEPGNHLDLGGLDWLESIVRGLECATIIISHNRYLLDRTVSGILEIDGDGSVSRYAGGYSQARMEKLRAAAAQGAQHQADRKKLDRLERLVTRLADEARNRPDPSKGKQLRARRTQLARAREEASAAPELSATRPEIELAGSRSRSDIAVDVRDYTRIAGERRASGGGSSRPAEGNRAVEGADEPRTLFDHASLSVATGERVGIVGPNGCGKSTFLRDLVREGTWEHETLRVGPSMRVGYLDQDATGFENEEPLLEVFHRWADLPLPRARAMLGRYLFTEIDMAKPLRALSGGERNRVQIARLVAEKANLLLLDEPTNHLDIPAREAVEEALTDFDGTVIVVSHDRYFLDAIATSIAEVTGGDFVRYEGGFTEFWRERSAAFRRNGGGVDVSARARMQRTARGGAAPTPRSGRGAVAGNGESGNASYRPRSNAGEAERIEERIISLEAQKESLEREIEALNDRREYRRARQVGTKLARLAASIDELYRRWE